jgi:hypothetical protein
LLEAALLSMAVLLSLVRGLDTWQLFDELFSLLCMLLDEKMTEEAGMASLIVYWPSAGCGDREI